MATQRWLMAMAAVVVLLGGLACAGENQRRPMPQQPPSVPPAAVPGEAQADAPLPVDDAGVDENFPGEARYHADLAAAEKAYKAAVMAARKRYVAAIRDFQMRAMMLPEQAQKIEAEVTRIENLPEPRVIPEPTAEQARGDGKTQSIAIQLDAPSPLWSVRIQEVRRVGDELWVLSRLEQKDGLGAMVITSVRDEVQAHAPALPVKHFVVGKTWNWKNEGELMFVKDAAALGGKWEEGKPVKFERQE